MKYINLIKESTKVILNSKTKITLAEKFSIKQYLIFYFLISTILISIGIYTVYLTVHPIFFNLKLEIITAILITISTLLTYYLSYKFLKIKKKKINYKKFLKYNFYLSIPIMIFGVLLSILILPIAIENNNYQNSYNLSLYSDVGIAKYSTHNGAVGGVPIDEKFLAEQEFHSKKFSEKIYLYTLIIGIPSYLFMLFLIIKSTFVYYKKIKEEFKIKKSQMIYLIIILTIISIIILFIR